MTEPHSLKRHPMREFLSAQEFASIANDVQFGGISWPICVETASPHPRHAQNHVPRENSETEIV